MDPNDGHDYAVLVHPVVLETQDIRRLLPNVAASAGAPPVAIESYHGSMVTHLKTKDKMRSVMIRKLRELATRKGIRSPHRTSDANHGWH